MRMLTGLAALLVLAVPGCTSDVPEAGTGSTPDPSAHDHGRARVSLPVGDGTRRYDVGYTLRDVRLPRKAGEPGRLSFLIENFRGEPQTRFLLEQTKRIHVYVVRDDLAVFRHVHPSMSADGTWAGRVTLPAPGDYRLVAEFIARDDGGNGDHVLLGDTVTVPGRWSPEATPAATGQGGDWGVQAEVVGRLVAGQPDLLRLRLTRPGGGAPTLGQYLGTSAHLTGFHADSGGAVHMHPLGTPVVSADAVALEFHSEMPEAGTYLLFVQVRVDDFLHTLPIPVSVA